jgi:hypothetical protein
VYYGSVEDDLAGYYLFGLQQDQRSGFFVIRDRPELAVLRADTSLQTSALEASPQTEQVLKQSLEDLLSSQRPRPLIGPPVGETQLRTRESLGANLNRILDLASNERFRSEGTLELLRELQQSDAFGREPEVAVAGTILISPSRFSASGSIRLGTIGIVSRDQWVYSPDPAGRWKRLQPLKRWLEKERFAGEVFAFLLRAHHRNLGSPAAFLLSLAHPGP